VWVFFFSPFFFNINYRSIRFLPVAIFIFSKPKLFRSSVSFGSTRGEHSASGSSEETEKRRKKLEYLMCFINIYMIVIFKSRQKQNMSLMKHSCFYANIIIYLTIWLLSVPFCHLEVKISIIRLEVLLLYVYTAHISYYHPKKKNETADSSHTCYFINTHIFFVDSWK
jgi:hypothetical protein